MNALAAGVELDQAEVALAQAARAADAGRLGSAGGRIGALLRASHRAARAAVTEAHDDGLAEARDALVLLDMAQALADIPEARGRLWALLDTAGAHLQRAVQALTPQPPPPPPPAPSSAAAATSAPAPGPMPEADRIVWRREVQAVTGKSGETIRVWIKTGKLPKPGVHLGTAQGWRLSALRAHGVEWV